jgi:hypothetical protein
MPSTIFNRGEVARTGELGGRSLLVDVTTLEIVRPPESVIVEDNQGQKTKVLRCTGRWQRGNTLNANGRWYGTEVLGEAVEKIQPDIRARGVMGEFDHPADAKIHMDRVSHVITKLFMEGNDVLGELEIIDELPYGQQLAALLKRKIRVGISSRGVGDMEATMMEGKEVMRVLPGYAFVTLDVVAEPSVSNSYLHLMESKQRVIDSRRQLERDVIKELKKTYFV